MTAKCATCGTTTSQVAEISYLDWVVMHGKRQDRSRHAGFCSWPCAVRFTVEKLSDSQRRKDYERIQVLEQQVRDLEARVLQCPSCGGLVL